MKIGDIVVISDGNSKFRAIGRITGEYQFIDTEVYNQTRPTEWLITYDESQPYEKILNNRFSQMTLYGLNTKVLKLGALKNLLSGNQNYEIENHVLIIDEINRGNIAKIFGELITLLEADKRIGGENQLLLTLPYSGETFGVPNNLHLIGTMNTADKSIALLDTALRRRFEFKELMPNPNLIPGSDGEGSIQDGLNGEINLRAFLTAINQRIQFIVNRDLTIGHAYLMGVRNYFDLTRVISQQIIPLLQEYFYEDWHRIQLVFRDLKDGNEKNEPQMIQHKQLNQSDILGYDHDEYEDKIEYLVTQAEKITPDMIRKVYASQ